MLFSARGTFADCSFWEFSALQIAVEHGADKFSARAAARANAGLGAIINFIERVAAGANGLLDVAPWDFIAETDDFSLCAGGFARPLLHVFRPISARSSGFSNASIVFAREVLAREVFASETVC